ncbi:MAG: MaoC family dehydratase [Fimbriimonadaceae bacterium]|nr:MaoC family dehydratase [Alphaproteobacteria bacterium]
MNTSLVRGYRLPLLAIPVITQDQINAYLSASGDDNPLHTDPELARRIGLDGIPIPGMLVMALVSKFVQQWCYCRTVSKLTTRFISPVIVDGGIIIEARVVALDVASHRAILRITVAQNGKVAAMAEAETDLANA